MGPKSFTSRRVWTPPTYLGTLPKKHAEFGKMKAKFFLEKKVANTRRLKNTILAFRHVAEEIGKTPTPKMPKKGEKSRESPLLYKILATGLVYSILQNE